MATSIFSSLARRTVVRSCIQQQCRFVSDLSASPLLSKIRGDLKEAMRNKDTARLSVLRGILAEVTNSAKTNNPLKTDIQLLGLLRKLSEASKNAAMEAQAANRTDLVERERAQQTIMEEYSTSVKTMSETEIEDVIQSTRTVMSREGKNISHSTILREVFQEGGALYNKSVEKSLVAKVVKRLLSNE